MRAIGFEKTGSIEELKILNVSSLPSTTPPLHVRLKFLAGALNHLDLWVIQGLPKLKYNFPHIAGMDICAEVLDCPSGKWKVGSKVIVYPGESSGLNEQGQPMPENLCEDFRIRGETMPGVFVEELLIDEKYVFEMPLHLNEREAAALPLGYLTAWQMFAEKADLLRPTVEKDAPILIHAAGSGVSQALLELCLSAGFQKIALTSRSSEKLKFWSDRGVKVGDPKAILQQWGLKHFDVIFDHVGEAFFATNIRLLARNGRFVTCGATSGFNATLDLRHLFFRQLQLLGSTMGSLLHFHQMLEWVSRHKIQPQVSNTFQIEDAKTAYQTLAEGQQNGKVILSGFCKL